MSKLGREQSLIGVMDGGVAVVGKIKGAILH
jgi:hypothetical protein